jgi:flavin reductase (DIM6/NTAB) family NADH-FMN oxidoreductase RutF
MGNSKYHKTEWKPGTMLYPLPAVLVSCGTKPEDYNLITIAWTGIVNSNPPMCYISVRKSRYSYQIIKDSGCFVINLTTVQMTEATDWCGVRSGRDYDKFKETKLTAIPAKHIEAPMVAESPVNLECRVKQIIELGSHDMFLSEIVCVHGDNQYIDKSTGEFQLAAAELITYSHGKYYSVAKKQGKFGFSVEGTKRQKKK